MPNDDFTLEHAKTLLRQSEQLAQALSLVHEQELSEGDYSSLQTMTCTLLTTLISGLETAITVIGVVEQGGMGEAPMPSALEPLSC